MATDIAMARPTYRNTRRWPRYKMNVPLRVIVHTADKIRIIDGRGTELNEGGMTVWAGVESRAGDVIEVEFTPPYSGQPLRVRSEIRNRSGYTYGVQFMNETPEDCDRVEQIRGALQGIGTLIQ